jgi:hypothetical protein
MSMSYGAIIIVCCAVVTPAHAQSYWEDGDFLRPAPKPGTFLLMDSGERYGVWRVVGASGNAAWTSGSYTHDGFQFLAQGDAQQAVTDAWVNLAGVSQSASGIAHEPVPTTIGTNYTLSFYVGNMYDPGGVYGTSSTVAVYENSKFLGKFVNNGGQGTKAENWAPFSITFAADAPYTVIAFINGDPPGDMNCGIDNIVFGPTAAAQKVAK